MLFVQWYDISSVLWINLWETISDSVVDPNYDKYIFSMNNTLQLNQPNVRGGGASLDKILKKQSRDRWNDTS